MTSFWPRTAFVRLLGWEDAGAGGWSPNSRVKPDELRFVIMKPPTGGTEALSVRN